MPDPMRFDLEGAGRQELELAYEELEVASEELRQQNQELVEARQALEAERTRYQELFDLAPDAYLVTDLHGRVQEANQAASVLLDVRRETLVRRSIWQHVPLSEQPNVHRRLADLQSGEPGVPGRWEMRLQVDGEKVMEVAVRVAAARPWSNEQPTLFWLIRDVSEQKEAERALQAALAEADEGRRTLDALMEYLPEGISISLGRDMKLTRVSRHGQELLGPHAGRTVREVLAEWRVYEPDGVTPMAPEDTPLARAAYHGEVVEGREVVQETARGDRVRLSCNAGPIRDAAGEITGGIVAWRDVTEQRWIEEAVRRLAQFPGENPEPVLRVTGNGRLLYANEPGRRWLESMGAPVLVGEGRSAGSVPDGVLEDDGMGQPLPEALQALVSKAVARGDVVHAELDNAAGRTFWLTLVRPAGESYVNIYARDITERKQAEDAMRENEAKLQALIDILPVGVSILDGEHRMSYTNPALSRIVDLHDQDLRAGRYTKRVYLHPDGSPMTLDEFPSMRAFREQRPVRDVEIGVIREDLSRIWVNVSAEPLPFADWRVIVVTSDITEKVQARQRVEEQAALVDTMLASIADSVAFYGPDARIQRTNAAADAMFGYVPGNPILSLAERAVHTRPRHEDGQLFALEELPVMRALRGETVTGIIMALDLQPGRPSWASVSAAPVRGAADNLLGAIVTFTDITELRRAREELEKRVEERTTALVAANQALQDEIAARRQREAELRESELRFRQLAENIDEVFLLAEPDEDRLLYLSPTYEEMLGRPAVEVYPRPELALEDVHPDDREKMLALWNGKSKQEEFRLILPGGAIRWLRGRVFAVEGEPGAPRRLAGLLGDITTQKEALAALVHAERLSTAGRMAASLAHEINNPLQSAIGCVDLAREDLAAGQDPSHYLVVVSEALARAARVVGQLRAMGRQWRQEEREPGDLKDAIDKVLLLTKKSAEIKGVTVIREIDEDLPAVQLMNDGIQQVLLNLVLNALDAMPLGGTLRVSVEGSEQPRGAWVHLADTGAGIPAADMEHLFEPFRSTKTEGLGLGLFICHNIVANHGGRIEVQSEEGKGTEVRVWLPA